VKSRVVAEVAEFRTEEELKELTKRAMEIMEFAGDEFAESYARGYLAVSKTIVKVYQSYWPPRAYIGWIFEDPKTVKEVSKIFRVFFKVKNEWRRIDCRELPAVFIDFEEYITFYSIRSHQLHPLDDIALRYLKEGTNMEKASKQLARDLAGFFKEHGGEVEWGVEDG